MVADQLAVDPLAKRGQQQRRSDCNIHVVGAVADRQADLRGRGQLHRRHPAGQRKAGNACQHLAARAQRQRRHMLGHRRAEACALRRNIGRRNAHDLRGRLFALRDRIGPRQAELLAQCLLRVGHRRGGNETTVARGHKADPVAMRSQRGLHHRATKEGRQARRCGCGCNRGRRDDRNRCRGRLGRRRGHWRRGDGLVEFGCGWRLVDHPRHRADPHRFITPDHQEPAHPHRVGGCLLHRQRPARDRAMIRADQMRTLEFCQLTGRRIAQHNLVITDRAARLLAQHAIRGAGVEAEMVKRDLHFTVGRALRRVGGGIRVAIGIVARCFVDDGPADQPADQSTHQPVIGHCYPRRGHAQCCDHRQHCNFFRDHLNSPPDYGPPLVVRTNRSRGQHTRARTWGALRRNSSPESIPDQV